MSEQIGMFTETAETNKNNDTGLIEEMKSLIETLNEASLAYYQEAREIMPNYEYDALYDRLQELENITGHKFPHSSNVLINSAVKSRFPFMNASFVSGRFTPAK